MPRPGGFDLRRVEGPVSSDAEAVVVVVRSGGGAGNRTDDVGAARVRSGVGDERTPVGQRLSFWGERRG